MKEVNDVLTLSNELLASDIDWFLPFEYVVSEICEKEILEIPMEISDEPANSVRFGKITTNKGKRASDTNPLF